MGAILLVTGGARSGKSSFAEQRAAATAGNVVYLATMEPGDDELTARIARHHARRPAAWQTVEAPLDLSGALSTCPDTSTVLLDCVSLWVSNMLFRGGASDRSVTDWEEFTASVLVAVQAVIDRQAVRAGALIVVTNEVGLGIVPAEPVSRFYRDALGLANQAFAQAADEAYLLVSGLPVRLK